MKLGPHCNDVGSNDGRELLVHTDSTILKMVNGGYGMIQHAKPNVVAIGRQHEDEWDVNVVLGPGVDPKIAARGYVDKHIAPKLRSDPWARKCRYFEGPNEQHPDSLERMSRYAEFEAERARILRTEWNVGACVGNFSTGTPDLPGGTSLVWLQAFRPALDAIKQYDGALGLHCYWAPGRKGEPCEPGIIAYHPLRFTWWLKVDPNIKIAITECGWESFGDPNLPGFEGRAYNKSGKGPQAYVESLAWYDQELRKYPQVLGATIYTFGNGWPDHNIEGKGITDRLIQYAKDHPMTPAPSPSPEPQPAPEVIKPIRWITVGEKPKYQGRWNLRTVPDSNAKPVAAAYVGMKLPVFAERGGFLQVTPFFDDEVLWLAASSAETVPDSTPQPEPTPAPGALTILWPNDYPGRITQAFRANPQNYRGFGLPGHEGLDGYSPLGAPQYAGHDGDIIFAGRRPDRAGAKRWTDGHTDPYGLHVRLEFTHDGPRKMQLIYAHFGSMDVKAGDKVTVGQVLGKTGVTGNTSGPHWHMTLKKEGATKNGETDYPYDIIDPTPYLK